MTKIKIEVEFEVDDSFWCANSEDQEERDWFWKEILPNATVILHSNEVGDEIASTNELKIKSSINPVFFRGMGNKHFIIIDE
jgi:hypothetical protein